MQDLITIFSSNIPIDCYILKGRLETDGIDCFVFDDNIVNVHPFKAVAIGGVKLKVPSDQFELAYELINQEQNWNEELEVESRKEEEILKIRRLIRESRDSRKMDSLKTSDLFLESEIAEILDSENYYKTLSEKRIKFTWKQFWYELFDPERNIFDYLRVRPVSYYIENDLIINNQLDKADQQKEYCPNCHSENIKFGYAIDNKPDILYLLLSLIIFTPFPPIRKNYYCFECGKSFKKAAANNS